MITTEELARIRAAAVGDMLGDSKALDEIGSAATIFRLCRELELARKRTLPRALEWTDEPPKVPGMYWNRSKNYPNEMCIINVSKYRIEQLGRMGCSQYELWAGPIPEPEPKKWVAIKNAEELCPKN